MARDVALSEAATLSAYAIAANALAHGLETIMTRSASARDGKAFVADGMESACSRAEGAVAGVAPEAAPYFKHVPDTVRAYIRVRSHRFVE